ncbi:hypothetical protein MMC17_001308 [Xylographa soralifera]|nr:hypothetical protein [Xylographa soralifera]
MAAVNNWKRPWEDKIDDDHGISKEAAPEMDRLPIPHLVQMPTRSEYDTRLQCSGETTPFSQDNSEPLSGSSSKQNLSPISGDRDRRSKRPKRQSSLSNPTKRSCFGFPEGGDTDFPDLPAPIPISSALTFQLEGAKGNRDDQSIRRGRASAPDLSFGRNYGQSLSGTTPELMDPSSMYDTIQNNLQTSCQTCISLRGVVHRVVSTVDSLHGYLSVIWKGEVSDQHEVLVRPLHRPFEIVRNYTDRHFFQTLETSKSTRPLPQSPLDQALEWAVERLDSSIHLLKETLVPRTPFPPNIPDAMIYGERKPGRSVGRENLRDKWERRGRLELPMNKPVNQHTEIAPPSKLIAPQALPSSDGERRKSIAGEYGSGHLPYSPLSTAPSVGPQLNFLHSPMQAPAFNRPLPSPSSLNFSSSQILPPLSPSYMGSKSPHTAHLQELQHQLSTKSLAHQILQGEHDKLLAAYSRSQTRCATLDKKSQVSDNEINNLVEDRIRLQTQVDALEVQVDALQQSKDEAQKQSVASGSQYMQIMGMSSRLQAQAAADLKKWKSDRDDWQKEKEFLRVKAANLEADAQVSRDPPAPMPLSFTSSRQSPSGASIEATETNIDSGDVLMSNSVEMLRAEIVKLRKDSREAEDCLQRWRTDSFHLEEIVGELNLIGNRMKKRAIDTSSTERLTPME